MRIGIGIGVTMIRTLKAAIARAATLLTESGDALLLEDGSFLLLE